VPPPCGEVYLFEEFSIAFLNLNKEYPTNPQKARDDLKFY
jgi:hypothetical protein